MYKPLAMVYLLPTAFFQCLYCYLIQLQFYFILMNISSYHNI